MRLKTKSAYTVSDDTVAADWLQVLVSYYCILIVSIHGRWPG